MHGCIYALQLSCVNRALAYIWHSPRNSPQIFDNRYRDVGKFEFEYFFENSNTDSTVIQVSMQSLCDVATRMYISLQDRDDYDMVTTMTHGHLPDKRLSRKICI